MDFLFFNCLRRKSTCLPILERVSPKLMDNCLETVQNGGDFLLDDNRGFLGSQ